MHDPGLVLPAMLPPPTLNFTIPSIHDNLTLQCRVYHPACLNPTSLSQIVEWRKSGAIVAHPYPPLGGCYDDPVVELVAVETLKQGFIVGTFNFRFVVDPFGVLRTRTDIRAIRGAGSSKGRTSWSSKPEQSDYISFIGFMIYYMHHLSPPKPVLDQTKFTRSDPELHDLSPVPSQALPPPRASKTQYITPSPTASVPAITLHINEIPPENLKPRLLLAGYSYGSMVTASLPPILASFVAPFQSPAPGSPHAEIRLRASCLATQQNESMKAHMSSLLHSHRRGRSLQVDDVLSSPKIRKSSGEVRMGGDEDPRRASHDSNRSRSSFTLDAPERLRKSVDKVRSIARSSRYSPRRASSYGSVASSHKSGKLGSESSLEQVLSTDDAAQVADNNAVKEIPGIGDGLQTAYLLISPLQGLVNHLATMWTSKSSKEKEPLPEHEMKLTIDPSLALFGDDDIFVSVKRLRAWAEKLTERSTSAGGSQFRHREIPGAGHFWHDYEAVRILREEVHGFVSSL